MKIEPTLDKLELKDKISEDYNVIVKNFRFVPEGEFASSYVITTEKNEKYFLKLYPPSRLQKLKIHQLDPSLETVYQLYHEYGIHSVSYPVKSLSGNLKSHFIKSEEMRVLKSFSNFSILKFGFIVLSFFE